MAAVVPFLVGIPMMGVACVMSFAYVTEASRARLSSQLGMVPPCPAPLKAHLRTSVGHEDEDPKDPRGLIHHSKSRLLCRTHGLRISAPLPDILEGSQP